MNKKHILFVCHGNICRSPMGEFLCKEAVRRLHIEDRFEIASAAVSQEEIGNGVYPPVRKILNELDIDCSEKRARQVNRNDLEYYDLIILMDQLNLSFFEALFNGYPREKVKLLLSFLGSDADVDDPWYTRDFQRTKEEISAGIAAMLKSMKDLNLKDSDIDRACEFQTAL